MINTANNLVTCECDINCDNHDPMPLCGNDGVSYHSLCHLKQTKCLQQRPIKIVDHYTCGKNTRKIISFQNNTNFKNMPNVILLILRRFWLPLRFRNTFLK